MAQVSILYFASVREAVGLADERREMPGAVQTVGELVDWLASLEPRYAAAFAQRQKLRCAVDQVVVSFDARLDGASEVAFFPPVTGG